MSRLISAIVAALVLFTSLEASAQRQYPNRYVKLDVAFIAVSTAYPLIKSGFLKDLEVSSVARRPETPEIPTLRELGLQNME
jgi:hypothetical protein